jgi:hypothetical protein
MSAYVTTPAANQNSASSTRLNFGSIQPKLRQLVFGHRLARVSVVQPRGPIIEACAPDMDPAHSRLRCSYPAVTDKRSVSVESGDAQITDPAVLAVMPPEPKLHLEELSLIHPRWNPRPMETGI